MRSIAKLFGQSPFVPLQVHMDKVAECVGKAREILDAFFAGDKDAIEPLAREISHLEFEADQIKYDIQRHLPKGLFMAVDRAQLQEILQIQDSLADKAENIGVLLTLKDLTIVGAFRGDFDAFLAKNVEAFESVRAIINQLDELLETGFGGREAEVVRTMVGDVARQEHEADLLQRTLLKALFAQEQALSVGDFHLWSRLFSEISNLSNLSERLANRIRRTLER